MKNLSSGTQCGGFQFLVILDLWGISVHAVVVFSLGKELLFNSVLGHCAEFAIKVIITTEKRTILIMFDVATKIS